MPSDLQWSLDSVPHFFDPAISLHQHLSLLCGTAGQKKLPCDNLLGSGSDCMSVSEWLPKFFSIPGPLSGICGKKQDSTWQYVMTLYPFWGESTVWPSLWNYIQAVTSPFCTHCCTCSCFIKRVTDDRNSPSHNWNKYRRRTKREPTQHDFITCH